MLSSAPLTIPHEQGGSGSPPPWALTDRAVSAPPDPPTWSPFQAPVRSGAGGSYSSTVHKTSLRRGGFRGRPLSALPSARLDTAEPDCPGAADPLTGRDRSPAEPPDGRILLPAQLGGSAHHRGDHDLRGGQRLEPDAGRLHRRDDRRVEAHDERRA